eukprot:TRINITY_DN6446_c0_g1_i1.p1 TRINITY_DN6446_c0_g1~~TRINITY_DN6446_c0_g1_i1.p1  ORF type:complete len:200 (-),score=45.57 TRINITY_DN6446_c0_g1_i1:115-693(-)
MASPEAPAPAEPALCKVVIIGDAQVGKSSLVQRFIHGVYNAQYRPTTRVSFGVRAFARDEIRLLVHFWDIGAGERKGTLTRNYYADADMALLVFDASRPETLDAALQWKHDIDHKTPEPVPKLLVRAKCDLQRKPKKPIDLDAFCKANGLLGWAEASAKENGGVDSVFDFVFQALVERVRERDADDAEEAEE